MRIVRKCCHIKLADYREMCYSICEVMHMLFKRKIYNKFSHGNRRLTGRKLCWWKVLVELENPP